MSKKILVLVANYPNNNKNISLMYVHTRNIEYIKSGHEVTVLSFKIKEKYYIDGVEVISYENFLDRKEQHYDILILHAANLRNHYRFLRKYEKNFPHLIFFYHGHEVLRIRKVYPKSYNYVKDNIIKSSFQDLYDIFKLFIWKKYIRKVKNKSDFVFVSQWMEDNFYQYVGVSKQELFGKTHIIYNSVDPSFEKSSYSVEGKKEFDFITIRAFMDGSKYCIDLVNQWAKNTPEAKFLIIGAGNFFNYYSKADNVTWINRTLTHEEIKMYLDKSRFALMPTRVDAQGLMMCEMAAYGIPIITSNIPICHEVFDGFDNAYFIDNDFSESLKKYYDLIGICKKNIKFYLCNTIAKELELLDNI